MTQNTNEFCVHAGLLKANVKSVNESNSIPVINDDGLPSSFRYIQYVFTSTPHTIISILYCDDCSNLFDVL